VGKVGTARARRYGEVSRARIWTGHVITYALHTVCFVSFYQIVSIHLSYSVGLAQQYERGKQLG
jgi:hypothetical protein